MRQLRLTGVLLSCLLVAVFCSSSAVLAVEASAENISRSYGVDQALQAGMIVSTLSNNGDYVEATNSSNASRVIGVIVKPDNSLVAVDPDARKAQVATSGAVSVLVSTVNGNIKAGDKIAPSPFSGIGMKALGNGYIAGVALGNFSSSSEGATSQEVTDKSGTKRKIVVGYAQINLTPRYDSTLEGGGLNGIQRFVRSLTGHSVSMPRIIISLAIAILTVTAIIILMYAAIYGSIVSIGRNPLARVSILRALARVVAMALLVFLIAFGLIYLLLR